MFNHICDFISEHWILTLITLLALFLTTAYWKLTSCDEQPLAHAVSLDNQSQEIEPGVRGSWFMKDGKLIETYYDDVHTTHEAFLRGLRVSKGGNFLGSRTKTCKQYQWITYQEVYDKSHQLGSSFLLNGLKPTDETFIGIYSKNNSQWVMSVQACAMYSMAIVPLYDTLGADACQFIIDQTQIELIICEDTKHAKMLIESCPEKTSVRIIVIIKPDETLDAVKSIGTNHNITVHTFEEMLDIGKLNLQKLVPAKPETINVISYTSGTTGNPKGVILTHKCLISNVSGLIASCMELNNLDNDDVILSYLPLAHMFERLNHILMMLNGGRIGFSCGDTRLILEDLQTLRPTIFSTVPRLLNRLYDKILLFIGKNVFKKFIYDHAVNQKINLLKRGIVTKNTIWDYLFFYKVQNALGGRVKICITGSAPCSTPVLNFVRAALGCHIYESYGQTEVTGASTITFPNEFVSGHVGAPVPCNLIKLIDIPEMDCYAKKKKVPTATLR